MKPARWKLGVWLLIHLIGFAALGLSWAALNDIFHDYVSPQALADAGIQATLPEWTHASSEWNAVLITWAFLLIWMTLNTLIIGWLFLRRPSKEQGETPS